MTERDTWAVLAMLLALALAVATVSHTDLSSRRRQALLFIAATALALVFWRRLTP